MVCSGNVAQQWATSRDAYTDYVVATELAEKDEKVQAAALKSIMGRECREILRRQELTEKDKKRGEESKEDI